MTEGTKGRLMSGSSSATEWGAVNAPATRTHLPASHYSRTCSAVSTGGRGSNASERSMTLRSSRTFPDHEWRSQLRLRVRTRGGRVHRSRRQVPDEDASNRVLRRRLHVGRHQRHQLLDGERLLDDPGASGKGQAVLDGEEDDHRRPRQYRILVEGYAKRGPVRIELSRAEGEEEIVGQRPQAFSPGEHAGAIGDRFHPMALEKQGAADGGSQIYVGFHYQGEARRRCTCFANFGVDHGRPSRPIRAAASRSSYGPFLPAALGISMVKVVPSFADDSA